MKKRNPFLKCFLYLRKWNVSPLSLESSCFLGEPLRVFHRNIFHFFRCFHFTIDFCYCFRVFSFFIAFVYCFFGCFYFTTFTIVFREFSFHELSLLWRCFVRYFGFVLLYRECYGFERAFFTHRCFLTYTPSWNLAQPGFIKASLGPAVPSWRLQGLQLRFETDPAHLFVWITQCSANGIRYQVLLIQ